MYEEDQTYAPNIGTWIRHQIRPFITHTYGRNNKSHDWLQIAAKLLNKSLEVNCIRQLARHKSIRPSIAISISSFSFAYFFFRLVLPLEAELPMSLKNLAVENVAIEECSDHSRFNVSAKHHHCFFLQNLKTVCFHGWDFRRTLHSRGRFSRTRELILCNWAKSSFDPRELIEWVPNVEKFAITGENLWTLKGDFPSLANLWAINITGTKLNLTKAFAFHNLPALRQLNLRGNELVKIVPFQFQSEHVDIYLQGEFTSIWSNCSSLVVEDTQQFSNNCWKSFTGNPWNCTNDMIWLLEEQSGFYTDKSTLVCKDWKYTGRPMMTAMTYKQILREHCRNEEIQNCTCRISYLRLSDSGKTFHPLVTVNCTAKGFYRLPSYLPPNTTVLHVSNNEITEVDQLATTDLYNQVQDIYLDNNKLTSIDVLEDSIWLDNFRILSLRGNQISRVGSINKHIMMFTFNLNLFASR